MRPGTYAATPILPHDSGLAPGDLSGRRLDTCADPALSRGQLAGENRLRGPLNCAIRWHDVLRPIQAEGMPREGSETQPPDGAAAAWPFGPARADPRLSRESSSGQSTAPHDDASVELHEGRSPLRSDPDLRCQAEAIAARRGVPPGSLAAALHGEEHSAQPSGNSACDRAIRGAGRPAPGRPQRLPRRPRCLAPSAVCR